MAVLLEQRADLVLGQWRVPHGKVRHLAMEVAPNIKLGKVHVARVGQVVGDSSTNLPAAQPHVAIRVYWVATDAIRVDEPRRVAVPFVQTNATANLVLAVEPTRVRCLQLAVNVHVHALPVALGREHEVVPVVVVCEAESVCLECRRVWVRRSASSRCLRAETNSSQAMAARRTGQRP